jgi:hypothetical protein
MDNEKETFVPVAQHSLLDWNKTSPICLSVSFSCFVNVSFLSDSVSSLTHNKECLQHVEHGKDTKTDPGESRLVSNCGSISLFGMEKSFFFSPIILKYSQSRRRLGYYREKYILPSLWEFILFFLLHTVSNFLKFLKM